MAGRKQLILTKSNKTLTFTRSAPQPAPILQLSNDEEPSVPWDEAFFTA